MPLAHYLVSPQCPMSLPVLSIAFDWFMPAISLAQNGKLPDALNPFASNFSTNGFNNFNRAIQKNDF